jgi:hypothetical protein
VPLLENDHLLGGVEFLGPDGGHGPGAAPADDQNVRINLGLSELHKNLLGLLDVLSKVISPLPLGERVRVRGKKGISRQSFHPHPLPSPLKGEGFPYLSIFFRVVFHDFFDVTILVIAKIEPQRTQRGVAATKEKTNYIPLTLSLPLGGGRAGKG